MELTERQKVANALVNWSNSFHWFESDRLSSIGVDNTSDLRSESPKYEEHMNNFFRLVTEIEDGWYATS